MLAPPVDIDKSIQWKRLWFKSSFETFFSYLYSYFISLLLIFGFIAPIFNSKIAHPAVFIGIACLFSLWMLANLFLLNKLAGCKADIADLKKLLDGKYEIDIQIKGELIRNVRPPKLLKTGRTITILIDGDMIYINITTLVRWNTPSPFHGFWNYLRCRQIVRQAKS